MWKSIFFFGGGKLVQERTLGLQVGLIGLPFSTGNPFFGGKNYLELVSRKVFWDCKGGPNRVALYNELVETRFRGEITWN